MIESSRVTHDGPEGRVILSDENWPLILVKVTGVIDPELAQSWHRAYVDLVDRHRKRYVYVIDGTEGAQLPATSRRVIAAFIKDHEGPLDPITRFHIGSVYTLPSALLRGLATAVFWIHQPKYRWRFSATLEEAERTAREWFETEQLEWSGIKQRL